MRESFPFRSDESRRLALEWYDRTLAGLSHADVETRFGNARVVQTGSGAPLVLLHGGGASAATLAEEIAFFAREGFRVIAPDLPGHLGRSEPYLLSYTNDDMGQWLADVLDAIAIDRPTLLGYSLGGLTALRFAEVAPERIARAVLVNPAGVVRPSLWTALPLVWVNLRYSCSGGDERWSRRFAEILQSPGAPNDPFLFDAIQICFRHWLADRRPLPVLREGALRDLRAPVLILSGEHDCILPSRKLLVRASRVIGGVTAERMERCGHGFDADSLARYRARSLAFLRS